MKLAKRIGRGRRTIQLARQIRLDTSAWECHLAGLYETAACEPGVNKGFDLWMLRDVLLDPEYKEEIP